MTEHQVAELSSEHDDLVRQLEALVRELNAG